MFRIIHSVDDILMNSQYIKKLVRYTLNWRKNYNIYMFSISSTDQGNIITFQFWKKNYKYNEELHQHNCIP